MLNTFVLNKVFKVAILGKWKTSQFWAVKFQDLYENKLIYSKMPTSLHLPH